MVSSKNKLVCANGREIHNEPCMGNMYREVFAGQRHEKMSTCLVIEQLGKGCETANIHKAEILGLCRKRIFSHFLQRLEVTRNPCWCVWVATLQIEVPQVGMPYLVPGLHHATPMPPHSCSPTARSPIT